MTCDEHLDSVERRIEELLRRASAALHQVDHAAFNRRTADGRWSPAEVLRHMMKANEPYLAAMERAIERAPVLGGEELRFTWLGRMLIREAGPSGNAPAPKAWHPEPGPYGPELADEWAGQTQEIIRLARLARGKNLAAAKVRNPLIPVLKLSLADCFELLTVHTERHVAQIEDRLVAHAATGR